RAPLPARATTYLDHAVRICDELIELDEKPPGLDPRFAQRVRELKFGCLIELVDLNLAPAEQPPRNGGPRPVPGPDGSRGPRPRPLPPARPPPRTAAPRGPRARAGPRPPPNPPCPGPRDPPALPPRRSPPDYSRDHAALDLRVARHATLAAGASDSESEAAV